MCKNILTTYQWWKQEVAESLGLKDVCSGFVSVGKYCFLVCRVALVLTLVHLQASFPLGSEEHGNHYSSIFQNHPFWCRLGVPDNQDPRRMWQIGWCLTVSFCTPYYVSDSRGSSIFLHCCKPCYLYHKGHHYHFQTNQGLVCMPCMYKRQIRWVIVAWDSTI